MSNKAFTFTGLSIAVILASPWTQALPDDENQEMVFVASRNEIFLDQGKVVYYGEPGLPAELSQGSLKITGMEIEILRRDGEVDRIIARGAPATFEQQPAIDQAIVYANGFTLVYDNSAQLLTLDEEAELIQQDATVSGHRIEYDMAAKTVTGTSKNAEERMRMVIPPQNRPE